LNTVQEIYKVITPFFGEHTGKLLFSMGMLGASLVAAIVVSLTTAWSLGEVTGYRRSLHYKLKEAPLFYGIYFGTLVISALLVSSHINLVKLNISVEVMNAMLLPIVLGFLYVLARKVLPDKYRLKGRYAIMVGMAFLITAGLGVMTGVLGSF